LGRRGEVLRGVGVVGCVVKLRDEKKENAEKSRGDVDPETPCQHSTEKYCKIEISREH
jgi:hypothetical protein